MITDWRLDASGSVDTLAAALDAERKQFWAGRKLRAENLYARAIGMAAGISDPNDRASAIAAAEAERALASVNPVVDAQMVDAIDAAVNLALKAGAPRCGISLVGHYDDGERVDGVNRRFAIYVDTVK